MIVELNAIVLGCVLEAVAGDPEGWPHPIRGVGWMIARGEGVFRRLGSSPRLSGFLFVASTLAAIVVPIHLLRETVAARFGEALVLFDGVILYLCLSINQLSREAFGIGRALSAGDLGAARSNLARLVSRKTESLEETEVSKAVIETTGENFSDGFFSPFFYFLLGGPAAAVAYKVINTFDSMIGYRDERYREFGWAAAKLDDLVNFIPARLAGLVLVLAAPFAGLSAARSWRVLVRDGQKHESPNAGIGKAAVAGALGVELGGPALYADGMKFRPFIGDALRARTPGAIRDAARHVLAAAAVTAILACSFTAFIAAFSFPTRNLGIAP